MICPMLENLDEPADYSNARSSDRSLVEGGSINSIVRMSGVAKHTTLKLLEGMGCACAAYHHRHVRGLRSRRILAPQPALAGHRR